MMRLLTVTLILGTLGILPNAAKAGFTSATLLSASEHTQFEEAEAPAVSQDGRYVVFQGIVDQTPGIYRRDLQTGAVVPVAAAANALVNPVSEAFSAPDAAGPSISADGQFVAFTTTADLPTSEGRPSNEQRCPSVYVRDMSINPGAEEPGHAGAYTLASVLGGSGAGEPERPISYGPGPCSLSSLGKPEFPIDGTQAAPGVALSADGNKVVFTVLSASNLGDPECANPECMTPSSQVAVRDLAARTTTLVSVTPQGLATPGGGAYPSTSSEQAMPEPVGPRNRAKLQFGDQVTGSSAAISADGSTVAWLGTNASEQAGAGYGGPLEVEPLWRRVADGASATTKRLLSGAGLNFGYFSYHLEPGEPVNAGSLVSTRSYLEFIPPALSADGRVVATLANAPTPASAGTAEVSSRAAVPNSDVYVIHVDDTPAAPVVARLTNTPAYNASAQATGDIKDVTISPDGTRVAFDTTRTTFAASPVALVSPPIPYAFTFETYEANLARGTLQQAVYAYDGSVPSSNAGLLSFSGDGETLAFASQAGNLFFGDAIGASEVYAVGETQSGTEVQTQSVGAVPVTPPPAPDWMLSATVTKLADGSVLLDADVPAAGRLGVEATAQLPAPTGQSSHAAHGATRRRALHTYTVSKAATVARANSQLRVRLRVTPRYHALVTSKLGLYTILRITFSAVGHRDLAQNVPVTFRALRQLGARHTAKSRGSRTHRSKR